MRVGLMSDSHDRVPAIREILRRMREAGAEMVLHCGDYCAPFSLLPVEELSFPMLGVFGRNDGDHEGLHTIAGRGMGVELYQSPHSLELAGKRVMLVHDLADVAARSVEAHEIVVHGFTHREEMKERGDTLIVNPGEACGWINGTPSYAVLDLDAKRVEFFKLSEPEWTVEPLRK
jgi:putative phosphoesterase